MIDETAAEISGMQTHSSSIISIRAAEALRELLERDYATIEEFIRDLDRNSAALRRADPSHASLYSTQHKIVNRVSESEPSSLGAAKQELTTAIEDTVQSIEVGKESAAELAAEYLQDDVRILTHDYSSTVIRAIEIAASGGALLDVVVPEARPRLIGRKTARELASLDNVDVTLIVDNAAGSMLATCDLLLIGMTCVVDDTLYNRIGTFPLVVMSNYLNVPAYATGSSEKVISGNFRFENDYRDAIEVLLEPSEGFRIENPAYDATPVALFDDILTGHS